MIKHGVKKETSNKDSADFANMLKELYGQIESKEKHQQIVLANPNDFNSWNYLKNEILILENKTDEIHQQLSLNRKAIQENPKSYAAWHHRHFLFSRWKDEWFKEHQLCNLLLQFDPRNFHCWNYCLKNKFNIKEVLHNYTSMHFKPYRAKAIFIDSNDEGVWNMFEKRRGQEIALYKGIVRKYADHLEIVFNEIFQGNLEIESQKIEQVSPTLRMKVEMCTKKAHFQSFLLNGRSMDVFEESIPPLINEILELEPNCIYALKNKLSYAYGNEREEIMVKLQKLDPFRGNYYRFLFENKFSTFIFTERPIS